MQADNRFCRNCPHHRDGHLGHQMRFRERICYGNIVDPEDDNLLMNCPCKEFVPKENLEYLEWCYNKNVYNSNTKSR